MNVKPRAGAQTIYAADGQALFLGQWDPKPLFKVVSGGDERYWHGKRVLDIGANTFGLSIEIARAGAEVVAIEPDPYNWSFDLVSSTVEGTIRDERLNLTIQKDGLFNADKYGPFDVVLVLGLLYHFRDPQYILDYISTLDLKDIVISTQTADGADLVLQNRLDIKSLPVGFWSADIVLSGWHPTHPLLERMLMWAGFGNITALTDPSVNFPQKPLQGVTNSAYYRATKFKATDPNESRRVYYPR